MKLQTIANQIRRIQTPDDDFKISYHTNGSVEITIGAKVYRLNHRSKKMYRKNEKMPTEDLTPITTIPDMKRYLTRFLTRIGDTVAMKKRREYEELEILLAYLSEAYNIPAKFRIFAVNGVTVKDSVFTLRRSVKKS